MSLFLIYAEIGKPVPPSVVPAPLCTFPITIMLKGRSGPPRMGLVLTDGGSSASFLAFGNKAIAREGETLRKSLLKFIQQRLNAGAHPYLIFLWFDGLVESASIDLNQRDKTSIGELEDRLRTISPSELIEVVNEEPRDAIK